ncbi:MAG: sensor domain-containing diguanylate cyclase [Deltaproteobacteria bacterium]|nr:sensor domain-containing diguanylate cyclase [Deltaproteobacteria bacterium]
MEIHISDRSIINRILQRKSKGRHFAKEIDLGEVLREILYRANEFVPSEAGSILIDDPLPKLRKDKEGKLFFVACFGPGSESLVGNSLPDNVGIVGETYRMGRPYLSEDVNKDAKFFSGIDKKIKYRSRSIIALPIKRDSSVIGIIELINRKEKGNFDEKDLAILDVFAKYTSTLIANALDARRFEDLSKRDNLTGLFNDRYFYDRLAVEISRVREEGGELSLIFFDLDHFKDVNDTYGHLAGSRTLKEVAILVEDVLIGIDCFPARYGGDEYVIILPGLSLEEAGKHAEKIREAIASNTFLKERNGADNPPLNISGLISCSVGVASLQANVGQKKSVTEAEEGLVRAADTAMYQAKESGKNKVCLARGVL